MTRSRLLSALPGLLGLLLLSWGDPASGQSLTRGVLDGVVRDSLGGAQDGASVSLRDRSTGYVWTATTARDGRFRFPLLLPGRYELLAERFGYRPRRVLEIPVRPGGVQEVVVVLHPVGATATAVDSVRVPSALLAGRSAGGGQRFSAMELSGLPEESRALSWVSRLSSASGSALEFQGLPSHLSGIVVDGVPVTAGRHPSGQPGSFGTAQHPLSAFAEAELLPSAIDVEWAGPGGGGLSAYTRRGSPELRVEGFGGWSSRNAAASGGAAPGRQASPGLEGGVLVSGPIIRDSASFVAGLELWQEAGGPASAAADSLTARVAAIAADSFGVSLPGASAAAHRARAAAGFARVDWQVAATHSLGLRTSFAVAPEAHEEVGYAQPPIRGGRFEGWQFSAGVDLTSRLSDRVAQEIRVGVEGGGRAYASDPAREFPELLGRELASTRIIEEGGTYGFGVGLTGRFQQNTVRASETLYLHSGAHRLKFGIAAGFTAHDHRYDRNRSGEFVFSGLGDFARGQGVFVQALGAAGAARFTVPHFSAFFQDTWRAAPGLELLGGLRYEMQGLPREEVIPNAEWLRLTGLDNAAIPAMRGGLSPRVGFVWDIQQQRRWTLTGAGGLFTGSVDPAVLGELLTNDGGIEIRRAVGRVGTWPLLPDSSLAPVLGRRLTLLAPGFALPTTARASFGLSHFPGASTGLHLALAYRRTHSLPRRQDLNLLPLPAAHDQHGRPLYGRLRRQGQLLEVENGSSRRFPGFEQVLAVNADGWSAYRGLTLAVEHRTAGEVELFASYTLSRTEDNWPGAGESLPAFPEERQRGWAEGTSDFDVPHRAVVGLSSRVPGIPGLSVAGLYRFRSGYPFTPGFREGMDANADGSARNDPAFVDATLPGMDLLLAEWPCLAASLGRVATRNSCRAPDAHALDLRLSLKVARVGGYGLSLLLDGLNLAATGGVLPDAALLRLDDGRDLATDPVRSVVTLPLRVNEGFGAPLLRLPTDRVLRLGLQVAY